MSAQIRVAWRRGRLLGACLCLLPAAPLPAGEVHYTYDDDHRLIRAADDSAVIEYRYDAAGNPTGRIVQAAFLTFTLKVAATGTGRGAVGGGGSYVVAEPVTLTATAETGSRFDGWTPGPCADRFDMPAANLTCTAGFSRLLPEVLEVPEVSEVSDAPQVAMAPEVPAASQVVAVREVPEAPHVAAAPAIAAVPDFVVSKVVLTPASPPPHGTFSAAVTVRNRGTAAGLPGTLQLWANQPGVPTCRAVGNASAVLPRLAAGAATTVKLTGLPAGALGTKTLRAFIDSTCGTAESSETNNQFAKTYAVAAPDFVVTKLVVRPQSPPAGGTFSVEVTVKNRGAAAGTPGVLRVWADHPRVSACGTAGDAAAVLPALAAGADTTVRVTRLPARAAGAKTLRAVIDGRCRTAESDESNNQATRRYTVIP